MPIYTLTLSIPANIPEDNPTVKEITVEGAILDALHVLIPPGHCALARLALFYGIRQIFPYLPATWLRGDGESLTFRLGWPLPELQTTLTFKGWNEDDTYQHTFYIRIQTLPEYRPLPVVLLTRVLRLAEKFLTRLVGVE